MTSSRQNAWGGPTDEAIVEAVREAYREGEVDLLDGGVPSKTLADEFDMEQNAIQDRLYQLVQSGDLVQVDGAAPETYRSRPSYLPTECMESDSAVDT